MLKMAVFAPMPSARVRTATKVTPGVRASSRTLYRMSLSRLARIEAMYPVGRDPWPRRLSADLIEGSGQLRRDYLGRARLDIAALHHVDELAVAKNADRGRRWGISREIPSRAVGGLD